ncbi:MAG: Gfo/Idh/MocA family oxidoreductase [Deltaproteobacteria bacterium]|nr:Gfo/Idh/MocA family oxidoreductase [Deltaproteobacteria bacterium]
MEKSHLPVLRAMPDVSVSWLADINFQKARALGDAHHIAAVDLSRGATFLPAAEVVLIAIPIGARARYLESVRAARSAAYVEKPLARSVEEHRALCSSFADYQLGCGFQRRSSGPIQLLRQIIKERIFGELRSIRFGWGSPGSSGGDGFLADLRLAGGGVLAEQAVHGIDAMLFCAGAKAIELRNARMSSIRNFDVHSEARALLYCDDLEVDCEITVSLLKRTINRTEYHWDHAVLHHTFDDALLLGTAGGDSICRLQPRSGVQYPLGPYQCLYMHWQNFIVGLREKRANYTSAAAALITTQLIESIYRAMVPLDGELCHQ